MGPMIFVLSLLLGLIVAAAAGALSGMRIGADALGAQLAAYMGGLYGLLSGTAAVLVGLVLLAIT